MTEPRAAASGPQQPAAYCPAPGCALSCPLIGPAASMRRVDSPAQLSPLIAGARVIAFSGHAGSGKTEIAVNVALGLSRESPTSIVDFDIINPFFRTADARAELEAAGVRLVAPHFAGTNVDVPALPGEIRRLFDDARARAVFDVGGDDLGAKAVSSFRDDFLASGALHFFVFNARRPMTSNLSKAERAFDEIQKSARVPFDAIVNNTHLLGDTSQDDLAEGLEAALALAGRVGSRVALNALMLPERCESQGPAASEPFVCRSSALGIPVLGLRKHIFMAWNSNAPSGVS